MRRTVQSVARSPWIEDDNDPIAVVLRGIGARSVACYHRSVWDGRLRAIVSDEPLGWHLSISHVDPQGKLRRYPSWDEIVDARTRLVVAGIELVMFLPGDPDNYVNLHHTTFHLYEYPARSADEQGPDPTGA